MRYLHEIEDAGLLAASLGLARDEIDEAIAAPAKVKEFTFASDANRIYVELNLSDLPCECAQCVEKFG